MDCITLIFRQREGTAIPSFVSRNLETGPSTPQHEQQIVAAGVGLVGGNSMFAWIIPLLT